ncbi:MAG: PH domain-containing protein [Candidatus Saccharimonadales bacterium]
MTENTYRVSKNVFILSVVVWGLLSFVIIGIIPLVLAVKYYLTTYAKIDNKGVHFKTGWLFTHQRHIPYSKVNNVDVKISPLGRWWNYGSITLFTGNDVEGISLKYIDKAVELKGLVESRI